MLKFVLDIFEGSYEELKLDNKVVCSILRTPPIHLLNDGNRTLSIIANDENKYTCNYDFDITIQPGQERIIVDTKNSVIAKTFIDSHFEEKLVFAGKTLNIKNDRYKGTISFACDKEVVATIKNYPIYRNISNIRKHNRACEIIIYEDLFDDESTRLFSCIVAAYPSFGMIW